MKDTFDMLLTQKISIQAIQRQNYLFSTKNEIFSKIEKPSIARHHKKHPKDLHLYLYGSSKIALAF